MQGWPHRSQIDTQSIQMHTDSTTGRILLPFLAVQERSLLVEINVLMYNIDACSSWTQTPSSCPWIPAFPVASISTQESPRPQPYSIRCYRPFHLHPSVHTGRWPEFLGPIATPAELLPLETHRCSHIPSRSLEAPLLPGHFTYSQANLVWSHSHTHTHSGFCTTDPQTHTCTE